MSWASKCSSNKLCLPDSKWGCNEPALPWDSHNYYLACSWALCRKWVLIEQALYQFSKENINFWEEK